MNLVYLASIGLLAPGLESWSSARQILAGVAPYCPDDLVTVAPKLLPPNERRRASKLTRLSLQAAQDAIAGSGPRTVAINPSDLSTVFASSHGDAAVTARICRSLTATERAISPTDFHNAVHNAPAGYWTIGVKTQAASTSVSLGTGTFAAGLLEAMSMASVESLPVLLVAADVPLPHPLSQVVHVAAAFAVALVLTPEKKVSNQPRLTAAVRAGEDVDRLKDPKLESLRLGNPAARSLPLLASIVDSANSIECPVILPYLPESVLEIHIKNF